MLYATPDSQASAVSSDLFMIRGDGQTTATNVGGDNAASAMIAEASSAQFKGGTILISRTTAKAANSDFYLFKVICR
jgi:hypothetical protein